MGQSASEGWNTSIVQALGSSWQAHRLLSQNKTLPGDAAKTQLLQHAQWSGFPSVARAATSCPWTVHWTPPRIDHLHPVVTSYATYTRRVLWFPGQLLNSSYTGSKFHLA